MITANYVHTGGGPQPGRAAVKRMWKVVAEAMDRENGTIISASGCSAALAFNYCVTRGYSFTVKVTEDGYAVVRRFP